MLEDIIAGYCVYQIDSSDGMERKMNIFQDNHRENPHIIRKWTNTDRVIGGLFP